MPIQRFAGSAACCLLLAWLAVFAASCGAPKKAQLRDDPGNYSDVMERVAETMLMVDDHLGREQIPRATEECEELLRLTAEIGFYEPHYYDGTEADFVEYEEQTEDMKRSVDRLLYFLQQRREEDALDQLQEVARRYNRLSSQYGPGASVKLTTGRESAENQ